MRTSKILTAMFCVVAVFALYGCGGSGYVSELPFDQEGFVSVHVDGVGGSNGSVFADKATFRDTADGSGGVLADDSYWAIDATCAFAMPEIKPLEVAALISVAANLDSCTLPSCCVYSMTFGDACSLSVDCMIDPAIANLDTADLNLEYQIYQAMQTNTKPNIGSVSIIVDTDQWLDAAGLERFVLTKATIDKSNCTGAVSSGTFQLMNDAPFSSEGFYGDSILDGFYRDSDTIGAVDLVGGIADCAVNFAVPAVYSLSGLVSGTAINESAQLIESAMQICDSKDEIGCEMNTLAP